MSYALLISNLIAIAPVETHFPRLKLCIVSKAIIALYQEFGDREQKH